MPKINVLKEAKKLKTPFTPFKVANIDDSHAYVAIIKGEFQKHRHPRDEFFYVLSGAIEVITDSGVEKVKKGEGFLVKKGTWHHSFSKRKSLVMLFEKIGLERELADMAKKS
jgi:mannose-6-phosphate isomerase-like protein (cupin superfamily)